MGIDVATLGLFLLMMIVLFVAGALVASANRGKTQVVDAYEIAIGDRDGFAVLELRFKLANGSVRRYELEAPFAHTLSDELCVASARAVAKRSTTAPPVTVPNGNAA